MSTAAMMRRLAQENGPLPPDVDGMGYKTEHVQGGAGFSYTRYSSKDMRNGASVRLRERFPSPFVQQEEPTSSYTVWLGMSCKGEDLTCPFSTPTAATCWAPDGEVSWLADFGDDGEAAEAFALSLVTPPDEFPGYHIAVSEESLPDYFTGKFLDNAIKQVRAQYAESAR